MRRPARRAGAAAPADVAGRGEPPSAARRAARRRRRRRRRRSLRRLGCAGRAGWSSRWRLWSAVLLRAASRSRRRRGGRQRASPTSADRARRPSPDRARRWPGSTSRDPATGVDGPARPWLRSRSPRVAAHGAHRRSPSAPPVAVVDASDGRVAAGSTPSGVRLRHYATPTPPALPLVQHRGRDYRRATLAAGVTASLAAAARRPSRRPTSTVDRRVGAHAGRGRRLGSWPTAAGDVWGDARPDAALKAAACSTALRRRRNAGRGRTTSASPVQRRSLGDPATRDAADSDRRRQDCLTRARTRVARVGPRPVRRRLAVLHDVRLT